MSRLTVVLAGLGACSALAMATAAPLLQGGDYWLSLGVTLLQYGVLATAWAMFSGPTRYVSLATAAFFGIGAYTVAVLGESMPWAGVLLVALGIGVAIALLVGLSTLRLSGVYFVIFSFGLAELVKQIVTWYEVNVTRDVGRHVFINISQRQIYWQLLALLVIVLGVWALMRRSRLGLALRVIGDDEVVATHVGIDTSRTKLMLFVLSAAVMTLTGAVLAPRWTYIDPEIAFNPQISFQVLIMALLGGTTRLFGPLAGAVPLVLLFEVLSVNFPNYFLILLGVTFMAIIYFVPNGVAGLLQRVMRRRRSV